ncbi:hypothetical protein ENKNEFLB_03928 [Nocardioides aquaticus]|uniref:Uncharacterized protein n=1 Tax=Nocardioides aquaticus TaxID=160826 RepID=A0ABX8EQ90_9ACTN|nr:hypothetical protein ENKNEFLB_03928 [Nocardioides aquaticus]
MTPMGGKRAGSRRGPRPQRRVSPTLLGLSLGVTLLVVAWGYLVFAAIDFGSEARGGRGEAWWFLGLASLGAVACLFAGLMLVARILRLLATPPAAPSVGHANDVDTVATSEGYVGRRVR